MNQSSNNKSRNTKYSKRSKSKRDTKRSVEEKEDIKLQDKANDPKWYIVNGQLAKDVASFSFNNALGASFEIGTHGLTTLVQPKKYSLPGIMTIPYVPSIGYSADGTSAANIAAKNFYSFVRHQNSGHANYDSPDLMMYLMAMDSIYAFYFYMCRMYGLLRLYSHTNRYIGDALIAAAGGDPSNLRSRMADFRSYINMFATKASAFATPATMSMYARHAWMNSSVFTDAPTGKTQFYMYMPALLYQYDEVNGQLKPTDIYAPSESDYSNGVTDTMVINSMDTLGFITQKGDNLLNAVVGSESFNIMSGDILKAYGENNLWKLAMIDENYVTTPFYSPEVLSQIHNTRFAGAMPFDNLVDDSTAPNKNYGSLYITQDHNPGYGAIISKPIFRHIDLDFDAIVDMYKDEVTPEDFLVASRNIIFGKTIKIGNRDLFTKLDSFGSDICLYAKVYQINGNQWYDVTYYFHKLDEIPTSNTERLAKYEKFGQSPIYYRVWEDSTGWVIDQVFGDVSNYTVVSRNDIDKVHQSALLSLFAVPLLGIATK